MLMGLPAVVLHRLAQLRDRPGSPLFPAAAAAAMGRALAARLGGREAARVMTIDHDPAAGERVRAWPLVAQWHKTSPLHEALLPAARPARTNKARTLAHVVLHKDSTQTGADATALVTVAEVTAMHIQLPCTCSLALALHQAMMLHGHQVRMSCYAELVRLPPWPCSRGVVWAFAALQLAELQYARP